MREPKAALFGGVTEGLSAVAEWASTIGTVAEAFLAVNALVVLAWRRGQHLATVLSRGWRVLSRRRHPRVVGGNAGRVGWAMDAYGATGSVGRAPPPA